MDLGADVRSIRRTRRGEMILELKRDKVRKGAAYKNLVVLGERVGVRAVTAEATLVDVDLADVGTEYL